jgi:peptidoglycan/LPS O-acetylase OafA/YrhL
LGIWSTARGLAAKAPAERNRYVDFLRAVSILVVVIGHWLIATAWYVDGELLPGHLLRSHPQYQWLTWVFQVMPIFFIVGGYSNAVSLESAKSKGVDYAGWLVVRLHRLVTPLLVLIAGWAAATYLMKLAGLSPDFIQSVSTSALIPTWFLSIYIMLVLFAAPTYKLWRRYGFASFLAFVLLAAAVDVAFFVFDVRWTGWSNYFWVWLAVHQLGFAWRDGRFGKPFRLLLMSAAAFVTLFVLIKLGPYPLAMVASPDKGLSNTLPPKATLLALALFQCGLLLALEAPMRRALDGPRLWTATVLVNSMIMSLYLWHKTVLIVVACALYALGGWGFHSEPGTFEWWWWRPVWIAALLVLLFPLGLLLSPLERRTRAAAAGVPAAGRQVAGAVMICLGIALLALWGFGGGPVSWLDDAAFALVIGGAFLGGILPFARS